MGIYTPLMARAPTTSDAFAAISEPKRREILALLAGLEPSDDPAPHADRDVTWLVDRLGWPQPLVSKHLAVLREVGLVSVERRGRRRVYTVNGERLKPVYEWVRMYERFWSSQLLRLKDRAERMERESKPTK